MSNGAARRDRPVSLSVDAQPESVGFVSPKDPPARGVGVASAATGDPGRSRCRRLIA
jgi:hypothetical protein